MGCDIHTYIEYRRPDQDKKYDWMSFEGQMNPRRNYNMFARLASVRGQFEGISLKPRGLPEGIGYRSRSDNQLYITETEGEGYVTMEKAKSWVEGGYGCEFINDHEGKPTWVTHPDWHSHSWLTVDEYAKVVQEYCEQVKGANTYNNPEEYKAQVAAMKSLQNDGYEVRIVFWFDN